MADALQASLLRLGTERLDLWQIHFPFPSWPQKTLAEGLQEAYEAGLVRMRPSVNCGLCLPMEQWRCGCILAAILLHPACFVEHL